MHVEEESALAASPFRLLDGIAEIVLNFNAPWLDGDDALAAALVCRCFHAAVCCSHKVIHRPRHSHHGKRFLTRRRGVLRNLALAQWATEQCDLKLTTRLCKSAAQINSLEVLEWLWNKGCAWDESAAEAAAAGGHLDVLKWLFSHNAPLSSRSATLALWGHHKKVFGFLIGDFGMYDHLGSGELPQVFGVSGTLPKVPWRINYTVCAELHPAVQALAPGVDHRVHASIRTFDPMAEVMRMFFLGTHKLSSLSVGVRERIRRQAADRSVGRCSLIENRYASCRPGVALRQLQGRG
jgi:hypothetical protein